MLDAVPLPSEMEMLFSLATPLLGVSALLYRTGLFEHLRNARRVANAVGLALALLILAFSTLLILSVTLFAFGIVSPP